MKVLIVSHNLISRTSNMGKTLLSYFRDFSPNEIAQFYIHSEVPTDGSVCVNYYRFTDVDALRSAMLGRNRGRRYGSEDIQGDRVSTRIDTGLLTSAYQAGRKRTAGVYLARNLVWKLSRWDNGQLWKWVEEFAPDVVFFASGDYGFLYDIARAIADHVNKPLVVSCVDDYYLYNRNEASFLGRILHKHFLKTVYRTMDRAEAIFVICPSMKREYEAMFGKRCCVLHTPAEKRNLPEVDTPAGIAYLGNLGLQRNEQLVQIGRALKETACGGMPACIDVYSGERNPEKLKILTEENGIRFHGEVSAEKVAEVMNGTLAVIHTESFDEKIRRGIRFSVSTKIADSLMNGPCLIAYGPEEVASIAYLRENGAAYTITDPTDLKNGLRKILTDPALRRQITERARKLAEQNHSMNKNAEMVREWLEQVCSAWEIMCSSSRDTV